MLCQKCHERQATVHFTKVINNNKTEIYLCEKCAKQTVGLNLGNHLNMGNFIPEVININTDLYKPSDVQDLMCEKCNLKYSDFIKNGKFGCDNCYEVFTDKLSSLMKRLHGSVEHRGRIPEKNFKKADVAIEIRRLKTLLENAVQKEEYEEAAVLRDQIKEMEAGT